MGENLLNERRAMLNVVLWSMAGAGPHYHGPGMNAWRLYSGLAPTVGSVRLLHANPQQYVCKPWIASHCLSSSVPNKLGWALTIAKGIQYLRQHRDELDIFHGLSAYFPTVLLALAAERIGIPAVVKVAANGFEVVHGSGLSSAHRRIRQRLMRRISAFVAISDEIANSLLDIGIDQGRIYRIPNGVDTEKFHPSEYPRERRTKRILFAGALLKRKRPHLVIEALQFIRSFDVQVVFAGPIRDQGYFERLKTCVRDAGIENRVQWLGFVEDLPSLMRTVDVVCLPSEGEGMANTILESMATGVPFVVTPSSGMSELVASGGGVCVDPEPRAIAGGLEQVLSAGLELGARGRAATVAKYSSQIVLSRHLELFEQLVRSRGKRTWPQ